MKANLFYFYLFDTSNECIIVILIALDYFFLFSNRTAMYKYVNVHEPYNLFVSFEDILELIETVKLFILLYRATYVEKKEKKIKSTIK